MQKSVELAQSAGYAHYTEANEPHLPTLCTSIVSRVSHNEMGHPLTVRLLRLHQAASLHVGVEMWGGGVQLIRRSAMPT